MFCNFCSQPCGEREFCDEVCYQEYQYEMTVFLDGIKNEGRGGYQDDNESFRSDADMGL